MKKIYIIPAQTVVHVNVKHHLMEISGGGSASVSSREADGDGFVKSDRGSRGGYNVWDDDWNK